MTSLKVSLGCCVIIYEGYNFYGKNKYICENTKYVGDEWNDKVSSIRIIDVTNGRFSSVP